MLTSVKSKGKDKKMKKLVCAVLAVGSLMAFAEDACKDGACKDGACKVAVAAEKTVKEAPKRAQLTPEQREAMKAKREKFLAERKAEMEAKILETIKKYIPEEEKAKALMKDLEETLIPMGRRAFPQAARKAKPLPTAK